MDIMVNQSDINTLIQKFHAYPWRFWKFHRISSESRGFLPMLKNINYSLIRLNYADHFLLNFSGRSLFLENTNVENETIIECLRAWNSNRGYQNLNFLSIELYDVFTDVRQIMNQFNVKEIEEERNPPVFMIPRRIVYFPLYLNISEVSDPFSCRALIL